MFSDPGFLSLVAIIAFWVVLVFLALAFGMRPRSWKKPLSRKRAKHAGILEE